MSRRRVSVAIVMVALASFAAWLLRPEIAELLAMESAPEPPTPEQITQGQYLARAGNCVACHSEPGRAPFAGGRRVATPFGDVFSGNLTPDPATGIGAWSSADFWRAMHYGKSRDGRRLYPAFPYTHYTRVSRHDSDAIFAYLQSLVPVPSPRTAPTLRFPYNTQLALLFWRALYFRPGEFEPDPQRSPQWNRGAYLVEGLGHCSACHTARTWLGGSDSTVNYRGGPIPMLGWDALPLALEQPMTDAQAVEMTELLKTGVSQHNVTTGPMAEVVFHSLQHLADADVEGLVSYIRSLPPQEPADAARVEQVGARRRDALMQAGAALYRDHCAECHGDDGQGEPYVYPSLAGNRLVTAPSPGNAIRTVLFGGYAPSTAGNPQPYGMPAYVHRLSFEEIAAVLTYVRGSWGNTATAVSPATVERH